MKFNSQICTTKEQSERLLALGLKKETADMYYPMELDGGELPVIADAKFGSPKGTLPAWSLHRLIEMMPFSLMLPDYCQIIYTKKCVFFERGGDMYCSFNTCDFLYDNLIDCIEWLIQAGHFNNDDC